MELHNSRPRAHHVADPTGENILSLNWHFSGYDRRQHDAGRCNYLPLNLGAWPDLYRRFVDRVDVGIIQVCPKDANGFYNFSAAASNHRALVEKARVVILEVNPSLPYCYGQENAVHESEVDFIMDGDGRPPSELPEAITTDVELIIARLIAAEIGDGDCLQIGIGGLPNAVCRALAQAGVKDLGVNTEMMVEGLVELVKAGVATGSRKQVDVAKAVYAFAIGSGELYSYINRNPAFETRAVDYTNLPQFVSRTTTSSRSIVPDRWTYRAKPRRNLPVTGTSVVPAANSGLYARRINRMAAGRSFACHPRMRRAACARAALSLIFIC